MIRILLTQRQMPIRRDLEIGAFLKTAPPTQQPRLSEL